MWPASGTPSKQSSLALLHPVRIIKGFCKCRKMHCHADSHEHMEDLVRLSPQIKPSRSPRFRYSSLPRTISTIPSSKTLSPFQSTYRIYHDSTRIQKRRGNISVRSGFNVQLAISIHGISVEKGRESGQSHEGEQKASQRSPGRLPKPAHEEHGHCYEYLRCQIDLEKENTPHDQQPISQKKKKKSP